MFLVSTPSQDDSTSFQTKDFKSSEVKMLPKLKYCYFAGSKRPYLSIEDYQGGFKDLLEPAKKYQLRIFQEYKDDEKKISHTFLLGANV